MRFLPLFFLLCAAPVMAQSAPKIYDFNDPKAAPIAVPYAAPGGVTAKVDVEIQNGALHFLNRAGGSFGVKFNIAPFDAEEFSVLSFDYTRSDDAKINLFFKVNGAFYGVAFSGPSRVRPGSFLLGAVPNVGNKGRAVIPLRDWLRRFQPRAEKLQVEEILAGNWDNEGYLLAGIGGNGPGATWSIDNLSLASEPKTAPRFATPRFEGNAVIWPLENGSTLDTRRAVVVVNGQNFDFASPFLRYETVFQNETPQRRVVLEAGDANVQLKNGQNLELSLGEARATLPFQLALHGANVPLPRLKWEAGSAPDADFETDMGNWSGANAVLTRDAQNPASGNFSLQFHNPRTASLFDATLAGTIDIAKFPIVTFRYRADDRLRADFRLTWDKKPYSIRFFDRDNPRSRLGTVAGANADGKWHLAQLPLLEWMKKARPDATDFTIESFGVADDAWLGNAQGVKWFLDDFRFAPQISDSLRAQVTLRDVSGVGAVAYVLDQDPETVPDSTPNAQATLEIPLQGRATGLYWLHVRAQNGAGKWSEVAHFPVVVSEK
ncbi:MAG: hypothetical protein KY445_07790 [Armatimonadetes bacterium]|nr:hypothetical protein [Armatimonadota bacterium]